MSFPVIVVDGLSKQYRVPAVSAPYATLRETIASSLKGMAARALPGSQSRAQGPGDEEFWALRDVSFSVDEGSVLGIIGVNGAGKSTLLKIVSRITHPTRGRVELKGRVASLLEVGTGFHRELTGRENIFLNGAILGMRRSEIRARFDEIVEFAEVSQFIDTPVKHYSSGMYVRLAFAVAANVEPDILIVDEVLAVGDARFQRKCIGKMEQVSREEGRTVIFVSHAMATVRSLCTKGMWLDRGEIRMFGDVGNVIHNYLESVVDASHALTSLETLPRHWPGHGERLVIKGVSVNDGAPVLFGHSLELIVDFEVRGHLNDVGFEIGFGSLDGIRILTIDSNLTTPGYDFATPGEKRVVARLNEVRLQPGTYTVDIAVRSGDHAGLDYLPACGALIVNAGADTPGVIHRETHGVRAHSDWECL
jgi:lipopolysaccharide transport system ATP-binding protein